MAMASLGSFYGNITANVNIVDIFRQNEITANPNCHLKYANHMVLKAVTINAPNDTIVSINGSDVKIANGKYEVEIGWIDITSLVFSSAVAVNIQYMY